MRVLIVTHQLSRTGAPMVALQYARWLRAHGHSVDVVALAPGELLPEFQECARVHFLPRWVTMWRRVRDEEQRRRVQTAAATLWARALFRDVDVVHSNTLACGMVAPAFRRAGIPVLSHVHELGFSLRENVPEDDLRAQIAASDHFICVSTRTAALLVDDFDVLPTDIAIVPPMASERLILAGARGRPSLCGTDRDFVVGACGTLDWRKGGDLLLQVAYDAVVRRGTKGLRFEWLGGDHDSEGARQLRHDADKMGLGSAVRFRPPVADPVGSGWYGEIDAFALTSREDPFPLVMQEAAASGLPIVGFAGTGGVDDFLVDERNGALVPFGDCEAMSAVLVRWSKDRLTASALGGAGRLRWLEDFNPDALAARVFDTEMLLIRQVGSGVVGRPQGARRAVGDG